MNLSVAIYLFLRFLDKKSSKTLTRISELLLLCFSLAPPATCAARSFWLFIFEKSTDFLVGAGDFGLVRPLCLLPNLCKTIRPSGRTFAFTLSPLINRCKVDKNPSKNDRSFDKLCMTFDRFHDVFHINHLLLIEYYRDWIDNPISFKLWTTLRDYYQETA